MRPPRSLVELLRARAAAIPALPAYTFLAEGEAEAARLAYADVEREARAVGAALRRARCAGERALLLYPHGVEFVAAFWGCLFGGAVAVPAYPPRGGRGLPRLRAIVDDARPRAVLTTRALLEEARAWFGAEGERWTWLATDALEAGAEDGWTDPGAGPETLAFLQYTSGSTAAPRGVRVSHGNLLHNLRLLQEGWRQGDDAVVVSWLPLFHDMGLIGNVLEAAHLGAPCVLMPPSAFLQRPLRWLEAVSRYGATLSGGPNFAFDLAVRRTTPEERARLDLSRWSAAFNGAEPVRRDTLERFYQAFAPCGLRREALQPGYGLAEATLVVSSGRTPGAPPLYGWFDAGALERGRLAAAGAESPGARALVGCGRVVGGQTAAIVDPETRLPCADGVIGEIWVKGPSVAGGYWGRPEESEATFRATLASTGEGPFLRTGDLGFVHGGELFVAGRAKDLVIVRGRNHFPQDLELSAERAHPGVRPGCGAAFSVEAAGEERLVLVCELERRQLRADPAPVVAAVRRAVAEEHEVEVHRVVLLRTGAIPKTTSGKIQRRACRAALLAGELDAVFDTAGSETADAALPWADDRRAALMAAGPAERPALVEAYLRERVGAALRIAAERLEADRPMTTLGLDSLMAVEMGNAAERDLGVRLPLRDLLDDLTLRELAAALAARLPDGGAAAFAAAPEEAAEAPPTPGQRAMWLLQQLEPESALFNVFAAVRVRPAVDAPALRRALAALVERHPALRTALAADEAGPRLEVRAGTPVDLAETAAAGWNDAALLARLGDEAHRPFDLASPPLLRAALFRRGADEDVLLLVLHHAAVDFWSSVLLLGDLAALYGAEAAGTPAELASPGLPFAAHARRVEALLAGPEGERLWDHWRARLEGTSPRLALPADRRPSASTGAGGVHRFRLGAERAGRVREFARERGTTMFTVLLAAWQALLHRWTRDDDLLVAVPAAGRSGAAWEDTVGCFMNPVLLRARLGDRPGFGALVERTRETVLEALQHQEMPLALLAERLPALREGGRAAPMQAMFVFNRPHRLREAGIAAVMAGEPGARFAHGGVEMEAVPVDERATPCELCLWATEVEGDLSLRLQYAAGLFLPETAARLGATFAALLDAALADAGREIAALPLLGPAEREQVLAASTGEAAGFARPPVHHAVAVRAAACPDAVAVVGCEGEAVTYAELEARAGRLARHLRARGAGAESVVGVCLERSPELIAALLAVLKAGAAYLPLDPAHPEERRESMLRDAGARLLVTRAGISSARVAGMERIDVDSAPDPDSGGGAAGAPPALSRRLEDDGARAAYVIYTSGSTGRPKGTVVPHAALASHTASAAEAYAIGPGDRVLQFASVSFDASAEEIYPALARGAALVLRPEGVAGSVDAFLAFCAREGVTVLDLPTAYWHAVAAALRAGEASLPAAVRLVIIGGERALPERMADWRAAVDPAVRLVNTYGPTEATVVATRHEVGAGDDDAAEVPIGRPIHHAAARVLDAALRPVPPGIAGELFLGGAGVARGYLGRPALTAEKFVPDPFSPVPGARMYATGDLARRREDGALVFAGRLDDQVKVRGYRVEPGEVEAALLRHPDVAAAAVLAREDAPGERRLVAYVAARGTPAPPARELRELLAELLPEWMVPAAFVFLPALPLNASGKVDRRALPAPQADAGEEDFVAPRTPAEALLAGIWGAVLGRTRVGVHDPFFSLGGDSIRALQVAARARRAGVELAPHLLLRNPSVARLAAALDADAVPPEASALPLDPAAVRALRAEAEPTPVPAPAT